MRQGSGLNITAVAGQWISISCQVGDAWTPSMVWGLGGCEGAQREKVTVCGGRLMSVSAVNQGSLLVCTRSSGVGVFLLQKMNKSVLQSVGLFLLQQDICCYPFPEHLCGCLRMHA